MGLDDSDILRATLRKIIGTDRVYITANDAHRHFDPITLATAYAGIIFLEFIKGAAAKIGDKFGKAVLKGASNLLAKVDSPDTADNARQLRQMDAADQAARLLGTELSEDYLKDFLDAGTQVVEQRLIQDNFPKAKARRIATSFATVISGRMKNDRSS